MGPACVAPPRPSGTFPATVNTSSHTTQEPTTLLARTRTFHGSPCGINYLTGGHSAHKNVSVSPKNKGGGFYKGPDSSRILRPRQTSPTYLPGPLPTLPSAAPGGPRKTALGESVGAHSYCGLNSFASLNGRVGGYQSLKLKKNFPTNQGNSQTFISSPAGIIRPQKLPEEAMH